ncbi:MAG: AI-2E family transporter [Patescibacteria group bacterium]
MDQKTIIDISTGSIVKVILVLLALWFLYLVRDIMAIIFVSVIIAAALSPTVDKLSRAKFPRVIAVIFIYLFILAILSGIIYFILPPMIEQLKQLAEMLPSYFKTFSNLIISLRDLGNNGWLNASQESLNSISNFLGGFINNIFTTTIGFFNGAAALAMIFILTLYFILDENGIKNFFISLMPMKQKSRIITIANKVGLKLGGWLRGQIILAIAVGVIVYIGLLIMGIPYALTLAIVAGILEIVPIIGPIISAVPAILLAFTISPTTALMVTIFYILVQELENKLLVPKVMQHAVGLNPVTIIIIILIGAKLFGILGILLAVPVASVVYVILEEWPLMGSSKK